MSMVEEIKNGAMAVEAKPKTETELMADMQKAVKSGDYKMVAKVASELVKFQKEKEQRELEAKQKVLADKTIKVKAKLDKAVEAMIATGELDQADGIWYANDFGEKLVSCRLIKTAPRAAGKTGGGGGGKKFSVSTTELLEKFGKDEYKDGQTFQAAWDANTDKNWRYAIREALLKKNGNIS
jgi:hypothetical protein